MVGDQKKTVLSGGQCRSSSTSTVVDYLDYLVLSEKRKQSEKQRVALERERKESQPQILLLRLRIIISPENI